MKTIYIQAGIFVAALVMVAAVAGFVVASEADIQYPVPELGNCADKDACKAYCDTSAHMSACISFAEKNQLMSLEEINSAKKFMENGSKGPGDCTGKDSCETYCNDISHIDECVAYAEQTGIMSPQDLAEVETDEIVSDPNAGAFKTIKNVPIDIGGHDAFRLEYEYTAQGGLKKQGIVCGFKAGGWMYRVQFKAAKQHYYAESVGHFERFVEKFQVL